MRERECVCMREKEENGDQRMSCGSHMTLECLPCPWVSTAHMRSPELLSLSDTFSSTEVTVSVRVTFRASFVPLSKYRVIECLVTMERKNG